MKGLGAHINPFIAVLVIVVLIPVGFGLGNLLSYRDSGVVSARAELAKAVSEQIREVSGLVQYLPHLAKEIGLMSMQIALAGAIVLIALGAFALLIALALRVSGERGEK